MLINDIAAFLGKQHFTLSQGSVYDSMTKFSDRELGFLIETMSEELTWLPHCVKSIRGYDQPVMIDYTQQLRDSATQDLSLTNKQDKATQKLKEKIGN
ncbi:hypothetical protein [Helicobacter typhlonius]|uniref:hypothetical protein n=1 Tax=Helicobacter typhlonius TaxID=76936 RepID=UPI002FE05661